MKILNIPLLLSIVRVVEGRVLAGTGGIEKKKNRKRRSKTKPKKRQPAEDRFFTFSLLREDYKKICKGTRV